MGSFSFTRAEATTKRANITEGDRYKILVPVKFGGGYIQDIYEDYGKVFSYRGSVYPAYIDGRGKRHAGSMFPECDLYGILAYWNEIGNYNASLIFDGNNYPMTMFDILAVGKTALQKNRSAGIDIGCYDEQIDRLPYPLKLVSMSYNKTYEQCNGVSYGDPNQGFYAARWSDSSYKKFKDKLIEAYRDSFLPF